MFPKCNRGPVHFSRISSRNMLVILHAFGQARAVRGNLGTVCPSMLANDSKMSKLIQKNLKCDREIALSVDVELKETGKTKDRICLTDS